MKKLTDYKKALKLLKPFYLVFALGEEAFDIIINKTGGLDLLNDKGLKICEITPNDFDFLNSCFEELDKEGDETNE